MFGYVQRGKNDSVSMLTTTSIRTVQKNTLVQSEEH